MAKDFLAVVNDEKLYSKGLRQDLRFRLKSIDNEEYVGEDINELLETTGNDESQRTLQCVFEHVLMIC